MFWLKWAKFGAKIINFKIGFFIWILANKFWAKLTFFYQYLLYNPLAFQQIQKYPKKLITAKIMVIFSKMVENWLFLGFSQLVPKMYII
jgi:hypothetical protein